MAPQFHNKAICFVCVRGRGGSSLQHAIQGNYISHLQQILTALYHHLLLFFASRFPFPTHLILFSLFIYLYTLSLEAKPDEILLTCLLCT